jgi:hypothetical protein
MTTRRANPEARAEGTWREIIPATQHAMLHFVSCHHHACHVCDKREKKMEPSNCFLLNPSFGTLFAGHGSPLP